MVKEPSILNNGGHKDVIGKTFNAYFKLRQIVKNCIFVDLIGNPTSGILTFLDDEVKLLQPQANFAEVVYERWPKSPVLIRKNLFVGHQLQTTGTNFLVEHEEKLWHRE